MTKQLKGVPRIIARRKAKNAQAPKKNDAAAEVTDVKRTTTAEEPVTPLLAEDE